jgi:hypothetical protein
MQNAQRQFVSQQEARFDEETVDDTTVRSRSFPQLSE